MVSNRSIAVVLAVFSGASLAAQEPGRRGRRPDMGATLRTLPAFAALDADTNGQLDAAEIANASTALIALDQDGDGDLAESELRPADGGPDRGGPERGGLERLGPERGGPERGGPGGGRRGPVRGGPGGGRGFR